MIPRFTKPFVLAVLAGLLCGATLGGTFALFHDLPQIRSLETYTPPMVTRVFSADGVLLAELFRERRDPLPLTQTPEFLKSALLATEDKNFYRHPGIDIKGIARAAFKNTVTGRYTQGASTITQQLAKTLFLTPEKTLLRKIREAILAVQLERRYTKDEILALYLNQVYFGSGAYGAQSAARTFFGKPAAELTLAECALIAGMPKAPSRYSPLVNPDLAIKRRNLVLRQMKADGIITADQFDRAAAAPLRLNPQPKTAVKAPYFVEFVKQRLEAELGPTLVYKGGLSVTTTLSYRLQERAENACEKGLAALEKRMRDRGARDPDPQCALIALGVQTGKILAMVGGRDFDKSPYNRCMARRQPGSAFKPLVYALAVEKGFPQNRKILDAPIIFNSADGGEDWAPENYSQSFLGEIPLRKALALSKNTPAVRLMDMLGASSVSAFARSLGIRSRLAPHLSLALGTSEVTPLDLTAAYSVFAGKGERAEPYAISQVADHQGRRLWTAAPGKKAVMSRQGAAIVCDMLKAVITSGTGRGARGMDVPVAGKTGTTDQYKDAWFVGFSPAVAAGVWVGLDRHEPLGPGETGARAALPIWAEFMKAGPDTASPSYFDLPDGTEKKHMDPDTGAIVAPDTPGAVEVLFRNANG